MPETATLIQVIYIPADTQQPVAVRELASDDVKAMQRLTGGMFEPVTVDETTAVFFNETGDLTGLPSNPRANAFLNVYGLDNHGYGFYGDAFIAGTAGLEYRTAPDAVTEWFRAMGETL